MTEHQDFRIRTKLDRPQLSLAHCVDLAAEP